MKAKRIISAEVNLPLSSIKFVSAISRLRLSANVKMSNRFSLINISKSSNLKQSQITDIISRFKVKGKEDISIPASLVANLSDKEISNLSKNSQLNLKGKLSSIIDLLKRVEKNK